MYVLVDGGFFVSRLARNWAPKGRFRRWMNKVERGKMAKGHFYQKARKSFYGELNYLQMRIKQAGYGKAEIHVMFDGTESRHARGKIYPKYKANRVPPSVEEYNAAEYSIRDSRLDLRSVGMDPDNLRAGWISHYDPTKEADDLIAEFVANNPEEDIIVFTQDSDLYQLAALNKSLSFHNFTEEVNPHQTHGFPFDHYADWKALAGDSSDNIPGVSNLGPTKATELIINYGDLENVPVSVFTYYTCTMTSALVLSEKIKLFQEAGEITDATLKRKWGAAILSLRDGETVRLNQSKLDKLLTCDALEENYFDKHSDKETIFDYRTIIKLPSALYKDI